MGGVLLGDWRIDRRARTLVRGDIVRRITPKAMAVLGALIDAAGAVVSRDALMDRVWPGLDVGEEVLTHAIAELRKALGDVRRPYAYVDTVYGGGYRLLTGVRAPAAAPRTDGGALPAFLLAQGLAEDGGRANSEEAVRLYRESIAADPSFAPAHAGLAVILNKVRCYYGGGPALTGEAVRHAQDAVALDPMGAEGHAALGVALSAAEAPDAAMAHFKTALRLRPDAAETHRLLARVYFVSGAYAASVAACERAARLRDDEFQCIIMGAKALRAQGAESVAKDWMRWARKRLDRTLAERPDYLRAWCNLFCCLVEEGDFDAAFALLSRLKQSHDGMAYYIVGALARLGEAPLALNQLEEVVAGGWAHGAYLASDPDLDPLRKEPRFRKLEALMA